MCQAYVYIFPRPILDNAIARQMKSSVVPQTATTPRHPISVVVDRTGLSQHLLRAWERRYAAVEPTRGEGGHRLYSDADIERFRLLHAATGSGRTIGQVAHLSPDELARLVAEDAAARGARIGTAGNATASTEPGAPWASVVNEALALTIALDAPALDVLLRRIVAQAGVATFTEQVVAPMLRRVGDEWYAGRLTIAQEHLASATVHDILVETMRALARDTREARVVVATPSGDRHAIGAALAGASAAAEGWGVVYLGTDVPAVEIAAAAVATRARAVAISMIYVEDPERTLGDLRTLRARLPASVTLLVGGAAATPLADDLTAAGIRVGASVEALRVALREALPGTPRAASSGDP